MPKTYSKIDRQWYPSLMSKLVYPREVVPSKKGGPDPPHTRSLEKHPEDRSLAVTARFRVCGFSATLVGRRAMRDSLSVAVQIRTLIHKSLQNRARQQAV